MVKKRGNNEGSIYRRKNGTWRAQVTISGYRMNFSAKTRKECQDWIRKTYAEIGDGMSVVSAQLSLSEYLDEWLINKKPALKYRTWTHYEQLIRQYISPNLGRHKINDIQPKHIQSLYNKLLHQQVGVYTIRKVHDVLHGALSHASRLDLIGKNPADAVIKPRKPNKEMVILDESQISLMLITAKGTRMESILHLAVTTGMRQMELLGLKWSDLDWIKKTLKVERQLVRLDEGKVQFNSPKTKYGRRTISLGSKSISVLRDRYERQHAERKNTGDLWTETGLIFTNSLGGPLEQRNLLRDFYILLQDAGLPRIRFHDLRHTAASLMLNHDVPVLVVSRMLGHSRPSITLDVYGHLMPSMQSEFAEKMDELITPIEVQGCTGLHQVAPEPHQKSLTQAQHPQHLGQQTKIPPRVGVKRWT